MSFGGSLDSHREAPPSYLPDGDPGRQGGGTYTGQSVEPTLEAYENIFGPSARDIKQDLQRFKRHGRWHLPDILKGPNQYLTDRVDGLITDATSSPFTSRILPYKYITNVDGKIKWNVWSFDEGLASRVPYESAARTLTQTKRSFAGYFIRQGMAIVLEHNFMMTEAGRENFRRQLNQLVGSIQLTNDLDVHVALVLAPSYQKTMNERYLTQDKSSEQICREFVELFGFVQKNQNALDILIEEAKGQLKTWGAPMPDFMLCNSKLTFQLTMTPDATNYVTQGPEGAKKLKTGPTLSSYRGIGIVHTRAFSMETGAPPRDMLRRRVRVAEYYRILPHKDNHKRLFQLYNEGRDTWSTFTFQDLLVKALCSNTDTATQPGMPGRDNNTVVQRCIQSMSSSAEPKAALAPRLGEEYHDPNMPYQIVDMLKILCTQLLTEGKPRADFSWEPQFLNEELVFVPGALDIRDVNGMLQADKDTFVASLSAYYANPVKQYLDAHPVGAGLTEVLNRAKIVVNSIAPYHRNKSAFSWFGSLDPANDIGAKLSLPRKWTFFDAAKQAHLTSALAKLAGAALAFTLPEQTIMNFAFSLIFRNYMRFGIPEELIKGTWGEKCNMKRALNLSADLATIDINDQRLRNLGAWFCPNHFLHPTKNFLTLGDFLGYHMLVSLEFVEALHVRNNDVWNENKHQNIVHIGTFLNEVIENPASFRDLIQSTRALIEAVNSDTSVMGNKKTKSELYTTFGAQLKLLITAEATKKQFDGSETFGKHRKMFWTLPRTERCDEEVYSTNGQRTKWKADLAGLASFQTNYVITDQVIQEMATNAGFDTSVQSVNAKLDMPAKFARVTDEDAINLFCMLAWRMWADQERSLDQVYNSATAKWPRPVEFLFPAVGYSHRGFGYGIMSYDDPSMIAPPGVDPREVQVSQATEHIEVVVVRPNIEHYMMGIILGQGGESLGSTFWGQTELSCYDDSMHGIWGMSYKYHERAIVINERNLIRLWDIAYDGYVGGKDDSAVQWDDDDETHPNSRTAFIQATTDVTRPYRGPSMMVMAFHHQEGKNQVGGMGVGGPSSLYKQRFSSNWPSPIVFYDRLEQGSTLAAKADFDNLHAVEVEQFRVFNSELYRNAYAPYRDKMPNFWELHTIRKNAGLAATENEVSSDALAFQGTMRVLSADSGAVIQEVLGSGHHGPDFIGVASLRAGKGYRLNSQPTVHRLV